MKIWNEVVEDGVAFPQEKPLQKENADDFFSQQTYTGVAEDNESGEKLVKDCLAMAHEKGFRILQFNAVVTDNIHAIHLYERLGFTKIGSTH